MSLAQYEEHKQATIRKLDDQLEGLNRELLVLSSSIKDAAVRGLPKIRLGRGRPGQFVSEVENNVHKIESFVKSLRTFEVGVVNYPSRNGKQSEFSQLLQTHKNNLRACLLALGWTTIVERNRLQRISEAITIQSKSSKLFALFASSGSSQSQSKSGNESSDPSSFSSSNSGLSRRGASFSSSDGDSSLGGKGSGGKNDKMDFAEILSEEGRAQFRKVYEQVTASQSMGKISPKFVFQILILSLEIISQAEWEPMDLQIRHLGNVKTQKGLRNKLGKAFNNNGKEGEADISAPHVILDITEISLPVSALATLSSANKRGKGSKGSVASVSSSIRPGGSSATSSSNNSGTSSPMGIGARSPRASEISVNSARSAAFTSGRFDRGGRRSASVRRDRGNGNGNGKQSGDYDDYLDEPEMRRDDDEEEEETILAHRVTAAWPRMDNCYTITADMARSTSEKAGYESTVHRFALYEPNNPHKLGSIELDLAQVLYPQTGHLSIPLRVKSPHLRAATMRLQTTATLQHPGSLFDDPPADFTKAVNWSKDLLQGLKSWFERVIGSDERNRWVRWAVLERLATEVEGDDEPADEEEKLEEKVCLSKDLLEASLSGREVDMIYLIEQKGHDPNAPLPPNGMTPLHILASNPHATSLIRMLLDRYHCNPNTVQTITGDRPLHLAAAKLILPNLELLISHGAQINPANKELETPMWLAARQGPVQAEAVMIYLAERGARLDIFPRVPTPEEREKQSAEIRLGRQTAWKTYKQLEEKLDAAYRTWLEKTHINWHDMETWPTVTELKPREGIPDRASDECVICATPFDLVNRRHHCRVCGNLVCSLCSQKRAGIRTVPSRQIAMLRVDDGCWHLLDNMLKKGTAEKWKELEEEQLVQRSLSAVNDPLTSKRESLSQYKYGSISIRENGRRKAINLPLLDDGTNPGKRRPNALIYSADDSDGESVDTAITSATSNTAASAATKRKSRSDLDAIAAEVVGPSNAALEAKNKLLVRGEKLDGLNSRSESLLQSAKEFDGLTRQIRRQQKDLSII